VKTSNFDDDEELAETDERNCEDKEDPTSQSEESMKYFDEISEPDLDWAGPEDEADGNKKYL
jgi:hypothetical protein